MKQQKNSKAQLVVIIALLLLTLPIFYLLVSRVLLPLEWDEPQYNNSAVESESG